MAFLPPLLKRNKKQLLFILRPLSRFEGPSPNFRAEYLSKVPHYRGSNPSCWPKFSCLDLSMAFMPPLLKTNKNRFYLFWGPSLNLRAPLQILEQNICQKCRIAEEVIHRVGLYINTSLAVMGPITQPIMCSLLTSCNTLNMKYKDHLDFWPRCSSERSYNPLWWWPEHRVCGSL